MLAQVVKIPAKEHAQDVVDNVKMDADQDAQVVVLADVKAIAKVLVRDAPVVVKLDVFRHAKTSAEIIVLVDALILVYIFVLVVVKKNALMNLREVQPHKDVMILVWDHALIIVLAIADLLASWYVPVPVKNGAEMAAMGTVEEIVKTFV